ncbi:MULTISPECIES: hypothetical protein [unclassified Novosphingobium]|uniref:hypothetical protein n=1 Tax=unclassified Novosphingobium TaxID=2644732 RepID=UPI000D3165B5|nr:MULTISPECIES: hypothetical protein [unclassified Novosphingobium]PTR11779.1 hypothetical protein C8K11_104138 [Novosphingobium sp. GV055]PUB04819.1 hypothetical protein C8K12_104138 [Novosphingobium sp. GV061]PUB21138.1 hypothetical protein C8K14_104138 [Novosphingobium sp. GV079]PUB42864.1 hypothetical protein C8K10_104138 [Novosphingobium sp. GV027]
MATVPRDWIELAIIAFILAGIGLTFWKAGSANPESTGSLGKKVNAMSSKVGTLSLRLGHLESEFAELKAEAATTQDVARIEQLINERINTMRVEIAGHRELAERTNRSVERIERLLIEKGLGR